MSIIPEVKCHRCGASYSILRSRCPVCGTRRVSQSSRTPDTTPGTVRGTEAYERANVNTRWQMIFCLILVVAVILAVIVMVSTGLTDSGTGTGMVSRPTPTLYVPASAVPTVEPAPTPAPTPTPAVQSIEIRYTSDSKKRDDVSMAVGEQGEFNVYVTPTTINLKDVEWYAGEEGYVKITPVSGEGKEGHVILEGIAPTTLGVNIYARLYGVEVKMLVRVHN